MSELKCNATFGDGGSIGHVWIYGGENTPDDWPCQCGALRYDESDELERLQKENSQLRQQLAEAQELLINQEAALSGCNEAKDHFEAELKEAQGRYDKLYQQFKGQEERIRELTAGALQKK